MEAALKDDDVRFAGGRPRQLDRPLQRLRPGIAEEKAVNGRRNDRAQLGDQLQHRLVDDDIRLRVQERSCLLPDGLHHLRVAVAGIGHANAAGKVEVLLSINCINVTAFTTFRLDGENTPPHGRHVWKIFVI